MVLSLRNSIFRVFFMILSLTAFAQAPTITSFTPTVVSKRSTVVITGTNLNVVTSIRFGGVTAQSFAINSPTQITATVGNTAGSGNVTLESASGNATLAGITFVAPAGSPAGSSVTRVISDWNGYWSSSTTSTQAANQPDNRHNMVAFGYGGTIYATGVNNGILTANSVVYNEGDYRSLPINSISGSTSASASSNYIILGTRVDGNPNASNYLSPSVSNLKVRDVLIDGIKGLDLGTGVTNINTSMVLDFSVSNIVNSAISDNQPDIVITQIADPSSTLDMYVFVDGAGNVVGTPVQANLEAVDPIGTYRNDLFNLPTNTSYSTASPTSNGAANGTRNIRMIAFKLSDFGITTANASSVTSFKVYPGGDSDPGFIAYNASAFLIPSPQITTQPSSLAVCPGTPGGATFTVVATGDGLTYQWKKNGVDIPGATESSYTIANVTASSAGEYSVVVSNASGSTISSIAYLNALTTTNPSSTSTCLNSVTTLSAYASGASLTYQWYSNTTNNTTTGTLIDGATNPTYNPPVNATGVRYYYAIITAGGQACTNTTTTAASVNVVAQPVTGTATGAQTICSGSAVVVSVSGHTGTIQWQQSANGSNGWANVTGGSGATSANYTTPALTATRYYRAVISNASCSGLATNTVAIQIAQPASAGTISGAQEVCTGSMATLTVSGATAALQWQQSADGTTNWTNVSGGLGAQTASYTTAAITATTYFRVAATNAPCGPVFSTPVAVTVRTTTWNGTTWTNGVPTITTTAVIAGNYTASEDLFACTLTVTNNATVSFPSGSDITLFGALTVNSGNVTLADKSHLIQLTDAINTGAISINRTTVPLKRLDYVLWSSPVSNQNLFSFSPQTTANRFYTYNPDNDLYTVVPAPLSTSFDNGKGYLIRMPNNHPSVTPTSFTGTFIGTPNNGTYNFSISNGDFNAVGNPYPSAISADAFLVLNDIPGALYFWRKTNNTDETSYATYTLAGGVGTGPNGDADPHLLVPNGVIASGQGFLYKAGSSTALFTNAMRTLSPTTLLRNANNSATSSTSSNGRIWLKLTNPTIKTQMLLAYRDDATLGIDTRIDGKYFDDSNLALTSLIAGAEYTIQGRPAFSSDDIVPLGFKVINAGQYEIAIDRADGILADDSQAVFLRDNLLGNVVNLRNGAYSFTSETGVWNSRFQLGYDESALSTDSPIEKAAWIYKQDNAVVVDFSNSDISAVNVYDLQGRLIASRENVNESRVTVNLKQIATQIVIVEAIGTDGIRTTKKLAF